MALELESSGLTDAGPHREINEDSLGCFAPADALALQRKGYLYVVADGLGGHSAGEVASSSAVARMGEEYYSPSNHTRIEPALRQAVQAANLRIHELTHRHPEYRSMETTLKYEGYLKRQESEISKQAREEHCRIPGGFSYSGVPGLSTEMPARITAIRSETAIASS